ncbi:FAD-dependent monooxygenase [Sphingomonas sp. 1P06PA]|uniref:NAD(P)/FAD-dependent oxidoreductase n=1 Tax=Sphingomonas sp. 1P06PA TaxID=554121 RepID=UPI0039A4231D
MRRTAALIVGGGPAGAAAAIGLAQGGLQPLLLERSSAAHDVVCGGFLGWDGLAALESLGLDPMALGARPIGHVRLAAGNRVVETDLPFRAAGLSRSRLDVALLDRAIALGVRVERGVAVRSVDTMAGSAALADGGSIAADALLIATGKHELRGATRQTGHWPTAIGLRTALDPTPALAAALDGYVELHLFDEGYAGLLLQEDGDVNLCLSIGKARLAKARGDPASLIAALAGDCPLLGERIAAARSISPWASIAGVPYGWRARTAPDPAYRLGDQAAVIASLAGDGVAIALASGIAAAQAVLRGEPAARFQPAFAVTAQTPLRVAGAARRMAESSTLRGPALALVAAFPGLARLAARSSRIGGHSPAGGH